MNGNRHLVSVNGAGNITVMNPPIDALTPDEALEFAAWIVALAELKATRKFDAVLAEVQNT